jgi:pimeloyl-ACP methyl ester carboxylesterase
VSEAAAPAFRHQIITAGGLRFHVAECGSEDGPPVLLLHGFPECWYSWRHQLAALAAAGFRAMAPDLRGYGESDKPARVKDYSPAQLAQDVVAISNALGYKRLDVVGHDWGGAIAWLTASFAKTKHVVRRLAILNAPHPALFLDQLTLRQLRRSWYMLFFQLPHLPEWLLRRDDFAFVRKIFSHTQALRKRLSDVVRENPFLLKRRVSPVEAETLLIWGERDAALGKELTEGLSQMVPRLQVAYLPAGHFVQLEQPDEVSRLLVDYLSRPLPLPTAFESP